MKEAIGIFPIFKPGSVSYFAWSATDPCSSTVLFCLSLFLLFYFFSFSIPSSLVLMRLSRVSDHVRLLGVTIAADLCLYMHFANVCETCFFWRRQVRRIDCPSLSDR